MNPRHLFKRLASFLLDLFPSQRRQDISWPDTRKSERPLSAEALEPRILYSAAPAPVDAPVAEAAPPAEAAPAEAAPAPVEPPASAEAAAPAPAADPAAVAPDTEAIDAAPPASGESDISSDQNVELVDTGELDDSLNQRALEELAAAAKQRWVDSGLSEAQIEALDSITYTIADLDANQLGKANGMVVTIDDDAAGSDAWFVDQTPDLNEEYIGGVASGDATNSYDLLSVILHEQGHVLGAVDLPGNGGDVMNQILDTSARRLPAAAQAEGAVPGAAEGEHFVLTPPALETEISLSGFDLVVTDALGGDTDDDLTITSNGTHLTIADNNGNNIDVSGVTASGSGTDTVVIALTEWTGGLIVNSLGGNDSISIGALTNLPGSVTVNGGDNFDQIEMFGTSVLALNANATFVGEQVSGDTSSLMTLGSGTIDLTGSGGISAAGTYHGVYLLDSVLSSEAGDITITGTGSDGTLFNDGVQLKGAGITTTGGSIVISGTGGDGIRSKGVNVLATSTLAAGGAGSLDIDGIGGTGNFQNEGVSLSEGSVFSVVDGDLDITGTGGDGNFGGIGVKVTNTMLTGTGTGNIAFTGTSAATSGFFNGGVDIKATTITTTGSGAGGDGNVSIAGTGSGNGTLLNDGVKLIGTDITAGPNATIGISGISNGTTVGNNGIFFKDDVNLTVTGFGSIFLDGSGSQLGTVNSDGIHLGVGTDLNFQDGYLEIFGFGGTASQGVQTVGTTITGTGTGSVGIIGQSYGTGGINQGIALGDTVVDMTMGSGSIFLYGAGSPLGTFSNDGVFLSNSHLSTGTTASIEIFGDGGGSGFHEHFMGEGEGEGELGEPGPGFFNSGVTLKKGSTVAAGGSGSVMIEGFSGNAKLINRGVWIDGSGSSISSGTGDITIFGDSHGSTLFNQGVFLNYADVITDGNISIDGEGAIASTSVFNTGVSIIGSSSNEIMAGGNLAITGTGGKGSTLNEGVRVIGVQLSGNLTLVGTAHAETTAGVLNTGVYMLNANLAGATAGSTITGFGGGTTTAAGNLNHGIYMQGITGNVYAGTTSGTKGNGALSDDEAGNFPFL